MVPSACVLALGCLACFPDAGMVHAAAIPVHQSEQDSAAATHQAQEETQRQLAKLAQEQQAAAEQIRQAEQEVQRALELLRQIQPRFSNPPEDPHEIDRSIRELEDLLTQLQAAQSEPASAETGPDITAAAARLVRLQSVAQEAQKGAVRATQIADHAQSEYQQQRHQQQQQQQQEQPAEAMPPPAPPPPPRHHAAAPHHGGRTPASATPPPSKPQPPEHQDQIASGPNSPEESAWFSSLLQGPLQYSVPDTMKWKVPATVTVRIQGEKATQPAPMEGQTGQASIKVSRRMKVMVSAPDNPDEFVIAPQSDTQLVQYVPEDGPTTWHFDVTPRYTASDQKLVVQAWVIYDANTQRELPVYKAVVNVHFPSFGESVKRLLQGDPDYWLKYGLPGGAGFIFFSGMVMGIWKWFNRKKKKPARAGH
jgi:hypothetical protein